MPSLFKASLVLIILLVNHKLTLAQQDCLDATFLCSSSFTQNNSYTGVGSEQEVAPGATCLGNGEVNSAWYRFTVNTSGSLNFQINPFNPNDDYDFALFDLTNDSCSGILAGTTAPVSCNYSSSPGATGLSNGSSGNNNGSSGTNQNAQINVQSGGSYALLISNFTASQNGYSIDFGGTALIGDTEAAIPDSIGLSGVCNPNVILLFFDEEFDCNSISGTSEISISGPATVNVTQVAGIGCADGSTNQLRIRFANQIPTTGIYTITIGSGSDGNTFTDGCGNEVPSGTTYSFEVEFIGPELQVTNVLPTNCGLNQGSAEAVVTNGTQPYSYNWNSSPVQNTPVASSLGPGTYRIRIIDDNGCRVQRNVVITNNSPFDLTNTSVTDVSCFGLSDGSAQLIPTGGQGPYTITWATTLPQNGQVASNLSAGNVTAQIEDATGCQESLVINIPEPSEIGIDYTETRPDCGSNNGSIAATGTGGTGAFSYTWDTNPAQSTGTLNNINAGVYTLVATDAAGCSNSETIILNNNFAPAADVIARVPDCGQETGSVTIEPTSGVAPHTFLWNTTPPQTSSTATGLVTGSYFVTITDANSCIQIMNIKVDSVPPPELTATLTQPTCGQADGEIAATVSNGTAPFSFVWSASTNTTSTETGLVEGYYEVTVTDSIGCSDSQTYALAQLPPESEITISAGCLGETTSFSFTTNSVATSWTWNLGDGTTATDSAPTHTYSSSGDFDISLSLSGGCMPHVVNDIATVYAPPIVGFVFVPETPTTRDQVTFTPTGTNATTFNWDFGDGTSIIDPNPTHQFLIEGFYDIQLTVTDNNGCEDTTSQTIEVLLEPVIYFPNAFAPNGSYENKVFKGYGIGVTKAELSIFNRWGTLVYFSASSREILLNGWDGKLSGKDAPQDVYAFKLKASFYNNTSFEKLGTVTLIR